ncbi:MAG: Gfo/Idh/MocA family protein [Rhizobiaceae bacterium]
MRRSPGHNRRFLPAFTDLRASVRAGQIGEILHLEGHLSASAGYAYRDGNWRTDPLESPAGGLAGAGIHVVDLMVALSGGARQVFAQADRRAISATMDDTTSALIKFRSGSSGYVAAVTATAPTFQFRVFGSKGMIALNGENGLERVELDGTRSLQLFGARDIERLELESFARCCRGEELYPIDLPEVRNGIAIFEAISLSARSQAPVEVRPRAVQRRSAEPSP